MNLKGLALLLPVEGEYRDLKKSPTLKQAQKLVGGYIETFNVSFPWPRGKYEVEYYDAQVLCNEDGLRLKLPHNELASYHCGRPLVGPVIVLTGNRRWT